jgi:N-acetyltransferase
VTWKTAPRTLRGDRVILEPLEMRLFAETCQSLIPDPDGWYSVMFGLNTPEAYKKEFDDAQAFSRSHTGMGFAIRDLKTNEIAGITFYLKMDRENRSLEIGTTNVAPRFRRTHINSFAKFLMLTDAFENLKCIRVCFRVDEENLISRAAVERLGAHYGGLLRNERILPDGRVRNYCFYSILDSEWPEIKSHFASRLRLG